MLRLTQIGGQPILVNVSQALYCIPASTHAGTSIVLTNDGTVEVRESLDEIQAQLEEF